MFTQLLINSIIAGSTYTLIALSFSLIYSTWLLVQLWLKRIQKAWKKAPVVWLSGVRRIGKTTLSKSIPDALYLNCDLPSVGRLLKEPDKIYFWRDKQKREVDFVIPIADEHCIAIECKWNPDSFNTRNLQQFRQSHPLGSNYVVSPLVQTTYTRTIKRLKITFCNLVELLAAFKYPN